MSDGGLLPRVNRRRDQLLEWLIYGEDLIYLLIGGLLAAIATVLLFSAAQVFLEALREGVLKGKAPQILDTLLLVLMLVEIMHTIRVSIIERTLVAEPFLIVALIAGIRRILILTTEASHYIQDRPETFKLAMVEMVILVLFFVVLVVCIILLRRHSLSPDNRSSFEVKNRGADPMRRG